MSVAKCCKESSETFGSNSSASKPSSLDLLVAWMETGGQRVFDRRAPSKEAEAEDFAQVHAKGGSRLLEVRATISLLEVSLSAALAAGGLSRPSLGAHRCKRAANRLWQGHREVMG